MVEESEETLGKTKEVQKKAEDKYKILENKMKNAEAEREKELKAAQQNLNQAKSKADAFNKKLKERQQVPVISCLTKVIIKSLSVAVAALPPGNSVLFCRSVLCSGVNLHYPLLLPGLSVCQGPLF